MATAFYVCFNCRIIKCSSKSCESPKDVCQQSCIGEINETNVYFDFCARCRRLMSNEFRRQLRTKELPPFNPPHVEEAE